MTEKVFPQKECGDFFNPQFVFLKMDMEKGEGIERKKQWNIKAFPTFIIFNQDGIEQHRVVGGGTPVSFIEKVKKGLNPETSEFGLTKKYNEGTRDSKTVENYATLLFSSNKTELATSVYKEYLSSLSDEKKQSKENWWLFTFQNFSNFGSDNFNYLAANRKQFIKTIGEKEYNKQLITLASKELQSHISGNALRVYKTKEAAGQQYVNLKKSISELKLNSKEIKLTIRLSEIAAIENEKELEKELHSFFKKLPEDYLFKFFDYLRLSQCHLMNGMEILNRLGDGILPRLSNQKEKEELESKLKFNELIIEKIKEKK